MTKIFLPLLTVLFLFSGCVHPSATIVIAEHNQSADALILRAYPCMEKFYQQPPWLPKGFCDIDFFIVISNNGRESIGVGNEWNSWGYSTLEMEVMDSGGVSCSLIRKEGTWYRNFPEFIEIPPILHYVGQDRLMTGYGRHVPLLIQPDPIWWLLQSATFHLMGKSTIPYASNVALRAFGTSRQEDCFQRFQVHGRQYCSGKRGFVLCGKNLHLSRRRRK